MSASQSQVSGLQAKLADAEWRLRAQKAEIKRWRTIAKCGPDAEQIRILTAMAMGGVHAMLHEDGTPRPCPTCPVQSMQELLQLTAEFSGTDKLVLTKKSKLISEWASWCRGTTHRRSIRRQGISDFLDQNPGYKKDDC